MTMGVTLPSFILTMRNVNFKKEVKDQLKADCFILTMRNVNLLKYRVNVPAE